MKAIRPAYWYAAVALLAVLPRIPGLQNDFARSLLSQMGIAAIFALSYNLLLGQTGLLSFGHAVYFGLGGYASIHLMSAINAGLPIPMPLVSPRDAYCGVHIESSVAFASTRWPSGVAPPAKRTERKRPRSRTLV